MDLKKIGIVFGVFLMFLGLSYATLSVSLSSQNPDPVSPGNFVYVNLKVTNSGSSNLEDIKIEFIEDNFFKIASGEDKIKNIGLVPAYSSQGGNFIISKFRLYVEPTTPIGENSIRFKIYSKNNDVFEYEFNILVEDKNPNIDVLNFNSGLVSAGEVTNLSFKIKNSNNVDLKNVIVKLGIDEVESNALSLNKGINTKKVPNLKRGEDYKVSYEILANPNIEMKSYKVPIYVDFEDNLGNLYSNKFIGFVKVFSEPYLVVNLESQEKYEIGLNKLIFAISNPGTSLIKGVQVEVLENENYKVLDGRYTYVGNLNPDDYQTIQTKIYLEGKSNPKIKLKITYLDSYNKKQEEIKEFNFIIYSKDELTKINLENSKSNSSSTIVIILVLVGIGFYFFRRNRKKKLAKK